MGRIKSTMIKRASRKLIQEYSFKDSFNENKKLLAGTMPSKKVQNKVAGYITKLLKMQKKN